MRLRLALSLGTALVICAQALPVAAESGYRTVVVFGDVQHLVEPEETAGYENYRKFVDWVIANRTPENIDFVLSVGDLIQHGRAHSWPLDAYGCTDPTEDPNASHAECGDCSAGAPPGCFVQQIGNLCGPGDSTCCSCGRALYETRVEWERFNAQWSRLEAAGIPNALIAGDHANTGGRYDPDNPFDRPGFAQFYGPAQMTGDPGYLESYADPNSVGLSHAWKFDLGSEQVVVLGLAHQFSPPLGETMYDHTAWANELITRPAHQDAPVIVLKHKLSNSEDTLPGRIGWNTLITPNPDRVAMAVWGHFSSGYNAIQTLHDSGSATDYDVFFQRSNWQSGRPGELEIWITLMRFYLDESGIDEIEVESFSPIRQEQFPNDPNQWIDSSRSFARTPFSIRHDIDHDGVTDGADTCPAVANPGQVDTDSDGVGDLCDNCPTVANGDAEGDASQRDRDGDLLGDLCDPDLDADGIDNWEDICPFTGPQDGTVSTQTGLQGYPCGCLCGDVDGDCDVDRRDANRIETIVATELGSGACTNEPIGSTCGTPDAPFSVARCDADGRYDCTSSDAARVRTSRAGLAAEDPFPLANGYHPMACWPSSLPDVDGDGVPDVDDNCPQVANPGQEASTQNGLEGLGCACLCGDINDSCTLTGVDALYIWTQIVMNLGAQPGCSDTPEGICGTPQTREVRSCDVDGSGACSAVDAMTVLRSLHQLQDTPSFPLASGYSPFHCAQDSPDPSPAP